MGLILVMTFYVPIGLKCVVRLNESHQGCLRRLSKGKRLEGTRYLRRLEVGLVLGGHIFRNLLNLDPLVLSLGKVMLGQLNLRELAFRGGLDSRERRRWLGFFVGCVIRKFFPINKWESFP